jgi:tetratricopeptide (TPR) repeat protein
MILPDERTLLAAQGYFELGMLEESLDELDSLPERWQERNDVLHLRMHASMKTHRWKTALEASRALCRIDPEEVQGFIHAAYCLHELGRTAEAKALLLSGPSELLRDATYYYNLACYDAVLGNIEEAQAYLRASFKLDKKFRVLAKADPDLEAVRGML